MDGNGVKTYKGLYRLGFQNEIVGRINGVAALTEFSDKKMYGRFAGTKYSSRNNEVTLRQGCTVCGIVANYMIVNNLNY